MRKVIAAINMTLDGSCDHTAVDADEEIHQHYTELISSAGTLLYGRITYQLMEGYWPGLVKNPSGIKSMDDFAVTIDRVPKIVFSHTIKSANPVAISWETAKLATKDLKEEVSELKQSGNGNSKDILVGSRSLIVALLNLNLIDEFQLCVHPVISGNNLMPLFKNIDDKITITLLKTKTFGRGAILLYYKPVKK